jgi:ribose 5-phosphate isomerase A
MDQTSAKRQAADAALQLLPERGVIGLGSGSTSRLFIEGLGRLVARGRDYSGVATSNASRDLAVTVGIPLLPEDGPWRVDVCVDGADEVNPALDLIKGAGGAHAREKIVNQAARRNIIIVDESKLSQRLGEKWAIPLEVLRFGWSTLARELEAFGVVQMRMAGDQPYVTDGGNFILDVKVGPIDDPAAMDRRLRCLPGVVETGLFVQRADVVLVAGTGGIRTLTRPT